MTNPDGYHVHVYFTSQSKPAAQTVVSGLAENFGLKPGSFHDKQVGPHPVGSCLLVIPVDLLGPVINWLTLNRQGLTIFIHAETGDVMKDHTEHTIWMGSMPELDMDFLEKFTANQAG